MSNQFILPSSRADHTRRIHTPTTFRVQRRLAFRTPGSPSISSTLLGPPGVSPPSSPQIPPVPMTLPWVTADDPKTSTLFKTVASNLKYPTGSINERTNERFLKDVHIYLFSNFQVHVVLVGERPHPFSNYDRLEQFWSAQGTRDWSFDTTKTFFMLKAMKNRVCDDFHEELTELLWFGGVLSHGNIVREVHAKISSWIDPLDFADVDGSCEEDDGVSFHIVIQRSLRVVRV